MSNSQQLAIPANVDQAIGFNIETAMDMVVAGYREASLFKNKGLPTARAEEVANAVSVLKTFFPDAPSVDVYKSSGMLSVELDNFFRVIIESENSDLRDQLINRLKARLYADVVKQRLRDVSANRALQSIATVDPAPMAVAIGERNGVMQVGALLIPTQENLLPEDVAQTNPKPKAISKAGVNRFGMIKRLRQLLNTLAVVVERAPWGRVIDRGSCGAAIPTFTTAHSPICHEDLDSDAFLDRWVFGRTYGGNAPANGNTSAVVTRHPDFSSVAVRLTGNGGTATLEAATSVTVSEDNATATWIIRTGTDQPAAGGLSLSLQEDNAAPAAVAAPVAAPVGAPEEVVTVQAGARDLIVTKKRVTVQHILWTVTVNNLPVGTYTLRAREALAGPANGQRYGTFMVAKPPTLREIDTVMSDAERLQYLSDSDLSEGMSSFVQVRDMIADEGVDYPWWLKSYHRYFLGPQAAFYGVNALDEEQVAQVRTKLLNVNLWRNIPDLRGLLAKLYDDVGSLIAIVQSTDFE